MTNARLVKADFDYDGDGTVDENDVYPASTDSNTVVTHYTYPDYGTYNPKVTLYFETTNGATANGSSSPLTCQTNFTVKQPPTVTPVATTPTPTPAPTPAKVLPTTGPAGVAGMFTGVSVLGSLGYRWRASRRLNKVDELVDRLRNSR
jgi:hypothetical protein